MRDILWVLMVVIVFAGLMALIVSGDRARNEPRKCATQFDDWELVSFKIDPQTQHHFDCHYVKRGMR